MKKLIVLIIVLALAAMAFADVIIGSGISTQRQPFGAYWGYERSASIYTAAEISGTGLITHLKWYVATGQTTNIPTKVYITTTTGTTLSATTWTGITAGLTPVYDATTSFPTVGWQTLDITDFNYTGTNLLVLCETSYGGYGTGTYPYFCYSTATNQHQYWYQDSTPPTGNGTVNANRPNITLVGVSPVVYPEPTNHVTSFAAGTLNYTSVQLNWTGSTGAQLPGSYLIQAIKGAGSYAAVADGTPVANDAVWTDNNAAINVAHVVGANTYTFAGLTPNTAYEFKIWPYTNSLIDINFKTDGTIPTVNASTLDPMVTPDYGQDFATWPAPNWTQLNYLYGGTPATGGSWFQDDWLNVTAPVNKAATINIYSTHNSWLVSPPVQIPVGNYELKFDLALMVWNSLSTPVTPGNQGDDRLLLVMADNPEMNTNPVIIREWNNTGSAFIFDSIPATGGTNIIPLIGFSGIKYFAFYAESIIDDAGDNDLMVDNFWVRQTPTSAIFNLSPDVTNWDFGPVLVNMPVYQTFTVSNTGGAALTFSSVSVTGTYYSPDPAFDTTPIPAGGSRNFTVKYLPTVVGGPYAGSLNFNFTRETRSIALSGSATTPAILPLTEGWESGQGSWVFVNGTQTNAWYIGTADPYAGTYSAYVSNDAGVTNAYNVGVTSVVHIYKDIAFDADMMNFPLTFKWKCQGESSYYDYLQVFVVDTSVTPVAGTRLTTGQVGINYNLQATWQDATITLPGTLSGTVKRVVFSWWNDSSGGTNPPINFDNVSLTAVPIPTGPPLAPTLTYPIALTGLPLTGFDVTWTPDPLSGPTDYYNVFFWTDDEGFGNGPQWSTTGTSLDPTNPPLDPLGFAQTPLVFNYEDRYNWTVEAYSAAYPTQAAWPTASWFEIERDPTINTFPYAQTFGSPTFPPALWTLETAGTYAWTRNAAVNGYGAVENMGAARANFYSQSAATPYDLITAPINLAGQGGQLGFDHAYATYAGEVDKLEIMTSNDAGATYNSLIIYEGGAAGPLNTGGTTTSTFVPTSTQWATKTLNIPPGTNRVKFRAISAFGNDLYIDNITLIQVPLPPHDVAVLSISDLPAVQGIGITYSPKATVVNNGSSTETFNVTMTFTGYSSTQTVTGLTSGSTALVNFANWIPSAAGNFTATVEAVVPGDSDLTNNTKTQDFNVFDSVWTIEANCPVGSYLGSAVSYVDGSNVGHIITSGGNTTLFTEVYDYNTATNAWTMLTNIPAQRRVHASAFVNGYLYIIGGSDAASVYQNTVYRYDLAGNTWATMAPLPVGMAWQKAVAYNNTHIIVAGGVDAAAAYLSSVYVYDIAADTWSAATPMPGFRFGGAFAITGNTLVYAAGATDTVITNAVYVGTITPGNPTAINWALTRSTYPGVSASYAPVGGPLAALEASFNKQDIRTANYPAGAMYRFDGATWGDDSIIAAGGSPTADWIPVNPGTAYTYNPTTDTWSPLPNLQVAVLGSYFNAVQSSPGTWKAVVASGYTGGAVTTTTQVYTKQMGVAPLTAPVVNINLVTGVATLSWAAVPNATNYTVYGSNNPFAADPWTLITTTSNLSYGYVGTETYKFFKVTASN